jgi:8-oxo-dGTP diphosphatase
MRPIIAVAAGCLLNAAGEVLIAQRPVGKIAAGQWEFPGGKIEHGESARQALVRELHEELGVQVREARPLIRITHDYSDRTVQLDTWRVSTFEGEPHGRENQAFAWVRPEKLHEYPLLAADKPIVTALRLPPDYVFTVPDMSYAEMLPRLASLPVGALLRLRQPALSDSAYADLAAALVPRCHQFGLGLMLDREPSQVAAVGASGWHASGAQLKHLTRRPLPDTQWFAASVHNEAELQRAQELGADFVVLGAVQSTASHPDAATLGRTRFAELVARANLPVYAIGGVGPAQHASVFAHYAQGTAGISAYWSVPSSVGDSSSSTIGTV